MIEEGYLVLWLVLLFASAGVLEHAGIKIPFFAFFAHDSGIRTTEPPRNMLLAMGTSAALCVVIGTFPEQTLYRILPFEAEYHPYDATHVLTQVQLLFFGALAFVALQKWGLYPPELRAVNIDAEWGYRRAGPWVVRTVGAALARVDGAVRAAVLGGVRGGLALVARGHGPRGPLARSWPVGSMVLWVAVLLAAFLAFTFI
jgi:multicomponent Na+:H+ antiporter subunit D